MKKILSIFLFSGILSLAFSFFLVNISLALELEAPKLKIPSRDATDVSLTPVFRWYPVTGAEFYNIYVDGRAREVLRDIDYQFYEEFKPGTYQWSVWACRVNPENNLRECSKSETWRFTTKSVTPTGEVTPSEGQPPSGGFVCPKDKAKCPSGAVCIENPLCAESFDQLVNAIINFVFWIAIAIAPIMFLIGGFYLVTAGGDPNRVATARKIMIYTAIGLAIVLFARGLIAVLQNVLGVK